VPFHLDHAQRTFGRMNAGRFLAFDVADAPVVSMTFQRTAQAAVR
jgi:hypothetical protein